MLVWLTNWQIEEDRQLITVGDTVAWTMYPADRDWVRRLFADRLVIEWQVDSYGDAFEQPSLRVSGRITELQSVRCRQLRTENEGIVPATGEATLQPVTDTSGSWAPRIPHENKAADRPPGSFRYTASYTSAWDDPEAESLYGYVAVLT